MGRANNTNFNGSLYESLILQYSPELSLAKRQELSIREKSTIYKLVLSLSVPTVVFCIDGVIITSGCRCDKLVLIKPNSSAMWDLVFVELKGKTVLHAIEQLRESLKKSVFHHPTNRKISARIVGHAFPSNKSNPTIEKAKIEFKKNYKCELKTVRSSNPDPIAL